MNNIFFNWLIEDIWWQFYNFLFRFSARPWVNFLAENIDEDIGMDPAVTLMIGIL